MLTATAHDDVLVSQIRNAVAQASAGMVPVAALADAIRKELNEVIRPVISSLAAAQDQNGVQVGCR